MKAAHFLVIGVVMAACLPQAGAFAADEKTGTGDIVAVAAGADNFKTLVSAIKVAGLVETLQGEGPFTVFAPTDEAFAKLPPSTLKDLFKPENKSQLEAILACHVVSGKVLAADVKAGKLKAVNGKELDIKVAKDGVTVDGAKVVQADIVAANGVIHAIDTVLVPAAGAATDKPKDHPAH